MAVPATALVAGDASGRLRPVTARRLAARSSPCPQPHRGPLVYHYPVKPFDRQHPIRGLFGDPRTISASVFGDDRLRDPGSYTFHNGVDIVARTGTPVYPVVSGRARIGYADEVIVSTDHGRVFQYFHIRPAVRAGQRVVADRTVLGRVLPGWHHVHLTEIDGFRVHDPLDPGHLEPYVDRTVPSVDALVFSSPSGGAIDSRRLRGRVLIAADASDQPPLPVPGSWEGLPVTPALVTWRLRRAGGRLVVPRRTVVDFRRTEPPNRDFWRVYASGTYQNFPVFDHHYFFGRPGRYLFNLTPEPLDTDRLANGVYRITVRAADVCGNASSLSELIGVDNPRRRPAAGLEASGATSRLRPAPAPS